jgi:RNA-binding protein
MAPFPGKTAAVELNHLEIRQLKINQAELSQAQKKHLKALAHHLKPVLLIGQHGLTQGVLDEMAITLDHHELIKVKISVGDREERDQVIDQMAQASGASLVHRIGNMAIFFRRNPKQPKIALPSG